MFVQQYDPFTMQPSAVSLEGKQDAYGPAMLSVLEYVSRMYGVHVEQEKIYWGIVSGQESTYEQILGEHSYRIDNFGNGCAGYIDDKLVFETKSGIRVITDRRGYIMNT